MRKSTFVILLVITFVANLNAQKYNTAVGLRAGNDLGFAIDQRIFKKHSLQLIHESALFSNEIRTSLTARKHYPLITRRFNMYLGAGGMVKKTLNEQDVPNPFMPGIQTTAGIELVVGKIQIAADFSPSFIIGERRNSPRFDSSSAVSLKYIIWKRKSKTKQRLKKLAFWNRIKL